jgi:sodium leak channel non-selective protein
MIPDTYCSPSGHGYTCPPGMRCMKIEIDRQTRGFNGFDELITSIFTVYEAASQEGWVFLMYRATDSLPTWRALFYFITMIFFLAWLVKNVFIAVIIETFAEIRVQFQQMWGARAKEANVDHSQVFERTENGDLELITIDGNKPKGKAPLIFQDIFRSPIFNMGMLFMVLANAIITATIKHSHREVIDRRNRDIYYYIEVVFTLIFNLEALFKIFCLGFKSYIKRSIYKFEFILAIGTTIRLIPFIYQTEFTYFQVLRIVRLIKSSPMLENFVNKVKTFFFFFQKFQY